MFYSFFDNAPCFTGRFHYLIKKVASPHVQVALQPHKSKKLNLVVLEKSYDFSYTIRAGESK